MSKAIAPDIYKTYEKQQIDEFELAFRKTEEIIAYIRLQEWSARGFIRIASGKKVKIGIPSKFPGKSLSEYLKDMRE